MRSLEQIKKEVKNLYGGDTEEFNELKDVIIGMMKNHYHVPKMVYILFHDFNTMSTPDSLGSYIKIYLKKEKELYKIGRKGKYILIDDDEYQIALNERSRVTGSKYLYYSKASRIKNKNIKTGQENKKKMTKTISTIGLSEMSINEAERERHTLTKKFNQKFSNVSAEELFKRNDLNISKLRDEYFSLLSQLDSNKNKIEFLTALRDMANSLGTDMNRFTIIYDLGEI